MNRHECPNKAKHTKCPEDYMNWHWWAEKKLKRFKPTQCPVCKLWVIWKRREKDEPDYGGDQDD